jgi:hypothetical protein
MEPGRRGGLRSRSADLGDVVGLVKDIAKFLDRLQAESLSEDSQQVRESLAGRIEFTLRTFALPGRRESTSSLELPPPPSPRGSLPGPAPPLPLSPPPPLHSLDSSLSSSHMSVSMDSSRTEEEEELEDMGRYSLPFRVGRPSALASKVVVEEEEEEEQEEEEDKGEEEAAFTPHTIEFQPQETSTPQTSPKKAERSSWVRAPSSMDHGPDTTGEGRDSEGEEEEDFYDSMVTEETEGMRAERRTDLQAPAGGIIKSAKILNAHAEHTGWLWRKESVFRSNSRFWALVYGGKLLLFTEPKDTQERESIDLRDAVLRRHKKGRGFVVLVPSSQQGKAKNVKHEFQTVNTEQATEWINHLQAALGLLISARPARERSEKNSQAKTLSRWFSQVSFSSSDEEVPVAPGKKPLEAMSSTSSEPGADDEYETVEIRPGVGLLPPARQGEVYDVPRAQLPLAAPSAAQLERSLQDGARHMRRESSRSPRPGLPGSRAEVEASRRRVSARQAAPPPPSPRAIQAPPGPSPRVPPRKPPPGEEGAESGVWRGAMTMGRRTKTRHAEGEMRARTQSTGVEMVPRELQQEMAPILDRIREKPAVPARPTNLNLEKEAGPAYSQVDRSRPRQGPGTLPRPGPGTLPRPQEQLGTSFLHDMVRSGRLGPQASLPGGAAWAAR